MPWAGGVYTRGYPSWTNDANANLPISATKFDTEDSDFASGISFCLNKDGSSGPTSALTWAQALTVASLAVTGNTPAVNGLYLPGGTALGFSTASTQRGTVDATGHWILAAPTSGATQVLDLAVNSGAFSATSNAALRIINANSNAQTPIDFFTNTSTLTGRIRNALDGSMNYVAFLSGGHSFYMGGDAGVGVNVFAVVSEANGSATVADQGGTAQVVGYRDIPLENAGTTYTFALADRGKCKNASAPTAFTIPANASVAFPVGSTIAIFTGGTTATVAITSDTLFLAGSGTTGTRTLSTFAFVTISKVNTTGWVISGAGIS